MFNRSLSASHLNAAMRIASSFSKIFPSFTIVHGSNPCLRASKYTNGDIRSRKSGGIWPCLHQRKWRARISRCIGSSMHSRQYGLGFDPSGNGPCAGSPFFSSQDIPLSRTLCPKSAGSGFGTTGIIVASLSHLRRIATSARKDRFRKERS